MKVVITGASGFVGEHLIRYLQGLDCTIYSIGRSPVSGVTHYTLTSNYSLSEVREIIRNVRPDYLFHLAGCVLQNSLSELYKINVEMAADLLEAITLEKLDRHTQILFVGSAAEYGYVSADTLPVSESFHENPMSHYGISKLTQTRMALLWSNEMRKILVVRPFTILGKGMPTYLAVGSFIEQINKIIMMGGKGDLQTGTLISSRDFLSVNDVVKIFWRLINNKKSFGKVINVCKGESILLSDVIKYSIKKSGCNIAIISSEERMRENDMKDHFGDNRLLNKLIGEFKFTPWQSTIDTMLECK